MPDRSQNTFDPPEDPDHLRPTGFGSPKGFTTFMFALAGAVTAGVLAIALRPDKFDFGEKRNAFFSRCIEFHSSDRCTDFWRYDRLDLAERPGR